MPRGQLPYPPSITPKHNEALFSKGSRLLRSWKETGPDSSRLDTANSWLRPPLWKRRQCYHSHFLGTSTISTSSRCFTTETTRSRIGSVEVQTPASSATEWPSSGFSITRGGGGRKKHLPLNSVKKKRSAERRACLQSCERDPCQAALWSRPPPVHYRREHGERGEPGQEA